MLSASGRLVLNVNASEIWHAVVRATSLIDKENYVSRGGGDDEKMLIGVHAVAPGTPGGTAVRLTPRKKAPGQCNVILHVGDVFEKYPKLRFTGRRKVTVIGDWDSAGRPYLEIQLQTQLAVRTISRKKTATATDKNKDNSGKKNPPPPSPDLKAPAEDEEELELESGEEQLTPTPTYPKHVITRGRLSRRAGLAMRTCYAGIARMFGETPKRHKWGAAVVCAPN